MTMPVDVHEETIAALDRYLGDKRAECQIPPPVFEAMDGEFVSFEPASGALETRFPVRRDQLNPFGTMQGGMIAAAVDNTIGPLSMLVAPLNVTRHLDMTYSRPILADVGHIIVQARYIGREGRQLEFRATVRDGTGQLLARAHAVHWLVDQP